MCKEECDDRTEVERHREKSVSETVCLVPALSPAALYLLRHRARSVLLGVFQAGRDNPTREKVRHR